MNHWVYHMHTTFHIAKQKWCIHVTVGYNPGTGKIQRTTKYCDSQKEALALQKQLLEKYSHNISYDANALISRIFRAS